MPQRDCIVVMARRPAAGAVKTRLAASLGARPAAELYEAFLLDTLAACAEVDARVAISYAPDDAQARRYFSAAAPDALLAPQRDVPFGERLADATGSAFHAGAGRVAVIGSDIPHVRPQWIAGAFSALDEADLAIGPTRDGGYYLLALRSAEPRLFAGIDWSSGRELGQTMARASELKLQVSVVPETFDVDVASDLADLESLIATDGPQRCPRTAARLNRWRAAPREEAGVAR